MSKVLLFGEPMALFTAKVEGDLESVNLFEKSVAGAELNVCTGLVRLGIQLHISQDWEMIH